jgi:PadR family transcriptional regulator PadR
MTRETMRGAALVALERHGEGYALEIIGWIESDAGRALGFFEKHRVYPVLRALEEEGLLQSRTGNPLPERGYRPRVYYRLTDEGRRRARESLQTIAAGLVPQGA